MTNPLLIQLLTERFSWPRWFFRPDVPSRDPPDGDDSDDDHTEGGDSGEVSG